MGVLVSKRISRKQSIAIIKRVLRETYRLNKHLLIDNLDQPYSFMFLPNEGPFILRGNQHQNHSIFEKFIVKNCKTSQ
jgi:ribonuclease P protein component